MSSVTLPPIQVSTPVEKQDLSVNNTETNKAVADLQDQASGGIASMISQKGIDFS